LSIWLLRVVAVVAVMMAAVVVQVDLEQHRVLPCPQVLQ
jgi:hypothetical protein